MLTAKDNFLETLKKGGKPDRLVNQWEACKLVPDPPLIYTAGNRVKGGASRDRWGTMIIWPEGQVAGMPHVTKDDKVLPDVTRWREYVNVPDIAAHCATGWERAQASAKSAREKGLLPMSLMSTGVFEQLHFLMGFEDTLMNFLLEPEAMHELIGAIGEYRLQYAKLIVEHGAADIVLSHDDWGTKRSLFISPDLWRAFIKPQFARLYGYFRDNGILVMHHADSFLEPIVEDMAEIGIDIWQGALPENDIPGILQKLGGRMTLMGGIDVAVADRPDSTEGEVRRETRRACETYGPCGHFIPAATYGGPDDVIFPHVKALITMEIQQYNRDIFGIGG